MQLIFTGKTNQETPMINVATFHLVNGVTLTLDRKSTLVELCEDELKMEWCDIYLWKINECLLFNDDYLAYIENPDVIELLKNAWVELEIEDDAPEEYFITDIEWIAFCGGKTAHGFGKTR